MQYEIDNELKYTTLRIRATLVWKRDEQKVKKMTLTQIPLGGMGNGLERAYSKIIFINSGYNIRELI